MDISIYLSAHLNNLEIFVEIWWITDSYHFEK